VGLPLPAIDLHRLLTGCTAAGAAPDDGRVLGEGWLSVAIGPERTAYLRERGGVTRVEAPVSRI